MVENSENYSSSRVSRIDYILYMVFKEVVVWKKKFVYQEKNQEIEKALGEFRKAIKELANSDGFISCSTFVMQIIKMNRKVVVFMINNSVRWAKLL
ncbi:hypothetical protein HYC85_025528 [Camellia sinensis]|uniref:Uncharacterized protein n=1 Tax=Camellia sinensis TaxID=4442 RepID=A0A7J7GB94_CAMSI|nr:hypothetical protein HYC85_025528 [Camellia sinensis]